MLSQILNENELNDEDPENVWIFINSRLEGIFGRDQILKSPPKELKAKYLKLIFELQDYELLRQFKEPINLWKVKAEKSFDLNEFTQVASSSKSEISEGLIQLKKCKLYFKFTIIIGLLLYNIY